MEITQELKQRYFALYWGQRVAIHKNDYSLKDAYLVQHVLDDTSGMKKGIWSLLLKDLRNITDEDAAELAVILYGEKIAATRTIESGKIIARQLIRDWEGDYTILEACKIIDFLRSKSYATDFMGIPVEKWIEAGVVKLKEA